VRAGTCAGGLRGDVATRGRPRGAAVRWRRPRVSVADAGGRPGALDGHDPVRCRALAGVGDARHHPLAQRRHQRSDPDVLPLDRLRQSGPPPGAAAGLEPVCAEWHSVSRQRSDRPLQPLQLSPLGAAAVVRARFRGCVEAVDGRLRHLPPGTRAAPRLLAGGARRGRLLFRLVQPRVADVPAHERRRDAAVGALDGRADPSAGRSPGCSLAGADHRLCRGRRTARDRPPRRTGARRVLRRTARRRRAQGAPGAARARGPAGGRERARRRPGRDRVGAPRGGSRGVGGPAAPQERRLSPARLCDENAPIPRLVGSPHGRRGAGTGQHRLQRTHRLQRRRRPHPRCGCCHIALAVAGASSRSL
jgi:hypothetical protein